MTTTISIFKKREILGKAQDASSGNGGLCITNKIGVMENALLSSRVLRIY